MTLSELSIKNAVFAVMLMAALIVFGWISYTRLGISQNPDVEFPVATITAVLQGAAPEVIESDVTEILEEAVSTVEGVRTISSTSMLGSCSIQVEFELNRPIDLAIQDVRDRVGAAARRLPRELEPPIISKVNPQDSPILYFALSGQRKLQEMTEYADDVIKPELQSVQGVGEIFVSGRKRMIRVWADANRLEGYGLSADDLITALQRQHVEVPGGRIESRQIEFNVRTMGEAGTVEDLNRVIVTYRNGSPLRLSEVAYVEDGLVDKRVFSRSNGVPSVGIGVRKQRGSNTVAVAHEVKARVQELRRHLPEGMEIRPAFDTSIYIEDAIGEVQFTLILAVVFTSLVTLLFLGSVRSTVIICTAIPTSLIGTFFVMYVLHFTLNTMTLLALSLSVGVVVDDAIMVLENIFRHREEGGTRREAAIAGSREITFAAMAATTAVVAIFLPVAFMQGIIGRFFFEFGVTISVAVLLSLVVALSLTPMLCSRFLDVRERRPFFQRVERLYERLARGYRRVLPWCLRRRGTVVLLALFVFGGSLYLVRFLGSEFVPSQDQGRFVVNLETPVGSSADYTDAMLRKCEAFLGELPEVQGYFVSVGSLGGQERGVNKASMYITLKPLGQRRRTQAEILAITRRELGKIPGLRAFPQDLSQSGFSARRGFPVEFSVRGPNLERLQDYSERIMARMRETSGIVDVDSDYEVGMPEANVIPDRQKSADVGVDMASIGRTVNALIGGVDVAKFKDRGRRYDIRVRLMADQRATPASIGNLQVRSSRGSLIRLRDLAKVEERPSLLVISRQDRQRAISVQANLAQGKAQAEALAQVQRIADEVLPEGYQIVFSGSAQTFKESFDSLLFALMLGILIAYMVLASQFNDFAHPFTILVALPFSFTGAILALLATGHTLNIYSMIGLILLMGLVKKNSILLVDFTHQRREGGEDRETALLTACPIRLRPILMTSTATIVGALPACVAFGPGAETRVPMGIAVVGGMVFSTGLTLFVVPVVYTYLDDLATRLTRLRRGGAEGAEPVAAK